MLLAEVDWFDILERAFDAGGRKTFHVRELAEIIDQLGLSPAGFRGDDLAKKLSSILSANVRSKTPQFAKVSNKKGGFRKGVYRIKPQRTLMLTPVQQVQVKSAFTGKAGEHAVLSELLFRGFNASIMTVDEGIDVVASKDNNYFHIQVKTANHTPNKPYSATLKTKSFQQSGNTFYIVVMRQPTNIRFLNEFAVFSSSHIRHWFASELSGKSTSISLRIHSERSKYFLNKTIDITTHINDFNVIC